MRTLQLKGWSPARRRVVTNIAANYAGAILNAGLPLLTLPLYFNYLGGDLWGLVSFVAFFVAALSLLDAGFSKSLIKEFAERSDSPPASTQRAANLLLGYERIYLAFALLVTVITLPLAQMISEKWLHLGELPSDLGTWTIRCASALFLVQLPGSIYRTVLLARQRHVLMNGIQVTFLLVRHAGSVGLMLLDPTIQPYLIWQVVCSCLESLYTSRKAWRELGLPRSNARWDGDSMQSTFRFAAVMAVSVLLGAATTMIDKFYVTAKLPISQLGHYGIAASVAYGLLRLSYPVFTAILPRLAQLQDDPRATLKLCLQLLGAATAAMFLFVVLYMALGRTALELWLRNDAAVNAIFPVLNVMLAGCALNIYYNIGFAHWVSAGHSRMILAINIGSFLLAFAVTPIAIDRFGLMGAAAAVILINILGAGASLWWIANQFLGRR